MRWELGLMEYEWGDGDFPILEVFDGDRWVASLAVTACETCGGSGLLMLGGNGTQADWIAEDAKPCPAGCFDGYVPVVPVIGTSDDYILARHGGGKVALVDLGGDDDRD